MKKKLPLPLRTYAIVSRAVEEGVAHGLRRYVKYHEDIHQDAAAEHLEREVLNALCEVVDFEDKR